MERIAAVQVSDKKNGFTLIEILAAITIAIILLGAVYETLNVAIKSKEKGIAISERNQKARVILGMIKEDLESASLSDRTPSWTFTATTYSTGSIYKDSLVFYALNQPVNWDSTGRSDEAIIQYSIDTNPDTGEIGLLKTINRQVTTPASETLEYLTLSKDINSLHFEYYDGSEWEDEWTETRKLPSMVRVTLGMLDKSSPDGYKEFVSTIRLPKA
jgi:prepilin-type N-terminal cleavage/methylation domain-containing protein